jgi:hypothetical protein
MRNEPVQPTAPKAKIKIFKQGTAKTNVRSETANDFKNRPAPNITTDMCDKIQRIDRNKTTKQAFAKIQNSDGTKQGTHTKNTNR